MPLFFVKNKELKEILVQDDTIKTALQLAQNADVILTSVGSVEYKTWENYLGESTFHLLGNKGAIGHIGGHFYDINGNYQTATQDAKRKLDRQ